MSGNRRVHKHNYHNSERIHFICSYTMQIYENVIFVDIQMLLYYKKRFLLHTMHLMRVRLFLEVAQRIFIMGKPKNNR